MAQQENSESIFLVFWLCMCAASHLFLFKKILLCRTRGGPPTHSSCSHAYCTSWSAFILLLFSSTSQVFWLFYVSRYLMVNAFFGTWRTARDLYGYCLGEPWARAPVTDEPVCLVFLTVPMPLQSASVQVASAYEGTSLRFKEGMFRGTWFNPLRTHQFPYKFASRGVFAITFLLFTIWMTTCTFLERYFDREAYSVIKNQEMK